MMIGHNQKSAYTVLQTTDFTIAPLLDADFDDPDVPGLELERLVSISDHAIDVEAQKDVEGR